jgi:hypothetical protein
MTLPASGAISFNAINVELGQAGTTQANINQASYRTLAGVPSGTIALSNFYGKSNRVAVSITISADTTNYTLNTAKVTGYAAGTTDVTLTINGGVYVYSTSTGSYAFTVASGWTAGDTITVVNNGTILGKGGNGGNGKYNNNTPNSNPGSAGGPAFLASYACSVNNVNRIAGGGGGGGGSGWNQYQAGSGKSTYTVQAGGSGGGGGIGNGSGGSGATLGGQAGGAGTLTAVGTGGSSAGGTGGNGGNYGTSGGTGTPNQNEAGSAAGGSGGAAGAAVVGNGNITWIATGTRNGSVS